MSKIRQSERGSAMMITVVVVIILVGLSAAMLSENLFRNRTRTANQTSNEAQLICDAGLEYARLALLDYRNKDKEAWGPIFSFCRDLEALQSDPVESPLDAKADLTAVLKWKVTSIEHIKGLYEQANLTTYNQVTTSRTEI